MPCILKIPLPAKFRLMIRMLTKGDKTLAISINLCLTHALKPNEIEYHISQNKKKFISSMPLIFHFLNIITDHNSRHNHNNNHNCVITVIIFITESYSHSKYVSIYMEINIHTIIPQCY